MSWKRKSIDIIYKAGITLLALAMVVAMVFISALVTSSSSKANTEIGVFFKSNHFNKHTYNEDNWGLFVMRKEIEVGGYENSYFDETYILGLRTPSYNLRWTEWLLKYGLVYGYGWDGGYADADEYEKRVLLYVLPTMSIVIQDIRLNTHYIGRGLAWSISYTFK